MSTRAFLYRRISGTGQQDNSSLEQQLDRMQAYCIEHGYEIEGDDIFTEIYTGIETWRDRPELNRLLRRVEAVSKTDDIVCIFDHPDRCARGFDLVLLVEHIIYLNARVEFVQTKFEDSDEGKIILHMQSYGSAHEWKRLKKRTTDGRHANVEKNHILGSTPSYGYTWNIDHTGYILNAEVIHTDETGKKWTEVMVVEFLFEQVKNGVTLRVISRKLTAFGIKTRKGFDFWHTATVAKILRNPIYTGKFTAFRNEFKYEGTRINKKGEIVPHYKRIPKPVDEHYQYPDGTVPVIIDKETFDYVQQRLIYNQKTSQRNNRSYDNALLRAGIAYCGYCGCRMHVSSQSHNPLQYQCPRGNEKTGKCPESYNTIVVSLLDKAIWRDVCQLMRNPDELAKQIEAIRTPDPTAFAAVPLQNRKKNVEEEIKSLVEVARKVNSKIARRKITEDILQLEEELGVIEEQEKNLAGEKHQWQEAQEAIDKFYVWCKAWEEKLEEASYNDKRVCLEYLGVKVKIFRFGHKPRYILTIAPETIVKKLKVLLLQSKLAPGGCATPSVDAPEYILNSPRTTDAIP